MNGNIGTLPWASLKVEVALVSLTLFWFLEHWIPFYMDRKDVLRHDARNVGLTLFNFGVLSLGFTGLTAWSTAWTESHGWGLLNLVPLSAPVHAVLAVALLDLWLYGWHRSGHGVALLWRFHRMHHTDNALDASSALRFHTGEVALSALTRAAFLPLLGVHLWEVLLFETVLAPMVQLQHSNIDLGVWDRRLRWLLVSPVMHRIHHSRERFEQDANLASVFSFWDRLLGTYNDREDVHDLRLGLDGWDGEDWQDLVGLLRTPFRPGRRPA